MLDSSLALIAEPCLCLQEISSKEKPWDIHKRQSIAIAQKYDDCEMHRYAERIRNCANRLTFDIQASKFNDQSLIKLFSTKFCRVRHCPICQWRRSLMWVARLYRSLPKILTDYPKVRFICLTLTVKNCDLVDLRDTINTMNVAWKRMVKRKVFPAIGYIKSVEVTRSKDDQAHPHFHCVLAVPQSYFSRNYLSQEKWRELWKSCLRVDYLPQLNVKAIKLNNKSDISVNQQLIESLREYVKYTVKPEDLINTPPEWVGELTSQLHKTRAISLGGIFKEYMSEDELKNLPTEPVKEDREKVEGQIQFYWNRFNSAYILLNNSMYSQIIEANSPIFNSA